MTSFLADLDELDSVVTSLTACHRRLAALGDDMAQAQRNGQASWDGTAAEAQSAAWADWQRGSVAMREALDRMRAAAEHARQQYSSAADLNVAMWRQLS
jgi:WXG100 family type VII secretion target